MTAVSNPHSPFLIPQTTTQLFQKLIEKSFVEIISDGIIYKSLFVLIRLSPDLIPKHYITVNYLTIIVENIN